MKKFLLTLCVICGFLSPAPAATNTFPILRGVLQTDLDAAGLSIANASSINATNLNVTNLTARALALDLNGAGFSLTNFGTLNATNVNVTNLTARTLGLDLNGAGFSLTNFGTINVTNVNVTNLLSRGFLALNGITGSNTTTGNIFVLTNGSAYFTNGVIVVATPTVSIGGANGTLQIANEVTGNLRPGLYSTAGGQVSLATYGNGGFGNSASAYSYSFIAGQGLVVGATGPGGLGWVQNGIGFANQNTTADAWIFRNTTGGLSISTNLFVTNSGAQILTATGSAGAPAYSFIQTPSSGLFLRAGTAHPGISWNGTHVTEWTSTAMQLAIPIGFGTAATTSDTFFRRLATGNLGIDSGGTSSSLSIFGLGTAKSGTFESVTITNSPTTGIRFLSEAGGAGTVRDFRFVGSTSFFYFDDGAGRVLKLGDNASWNSPIAVGATVSGAQYQLLVLNPDSATRVPLSINTSLALTTNLFEVRSNGTMAVNVASNGWLNLPLATTASGAPGIQFGPTTTSGFALVNNNGNFRFMRGDLSALGAGAFGAVFISDNVSFTASSSGVLTLGDNAGTSFNRINLGGTSSSYSSIGRNGSMVMLVKADSSDLTSLIASTQIVPKAAGYTVTTNELQSVMTDTTSPGPGATSFTLPAATVGYTFSFNVTAYGITVIAVGSDTIRIGSSVSAAAGNVTCTTIGNSITLTCTKAGKWVATAHEGTWTVN